MLQHAVETCRVGTGWKYFVFIFGVCDISIILEFLFEHASLNAHVSRNNQRAVFGPLAVWHKSEHPDCQVSVLGWFEIEMT